MRDCGLVPARKRAEAANRNAVLSRRQLEALMLPRAKLGDVRLVDVEPSRLAEQLLELMGAGKGHASVPDEGLIVPNWPSPAKHALAVVSDSSKRQIGRGTDWFVLKDK